MQQFFGLQILDYYTLKSTPDRIRTCNPRFRRLDNVHVSMAGLRCRKSLILLNLCQFNFVAFQNLPQCNL